MKCKHAAAVEDGKMDAGEWVSDWQRDGVKELSVMKHGELCVCVWANEWQKHEAQGGGLCKDARCLQRFAVTSPSIASRRGPRQSLSPGNPLK